MTNANMLRRTRVLAVLAAVASACGGEIVPGELAENLDEGTRARFGKVAEHDARLVGTHAMLQPDSFGELRVAIVELGADGSLRGSAMALIASWDRYGAPWRQRI